MFSLSATEKGKSVQRPEHEFQMDFIEQALRRISLGEMVIVVDDESRENEGDLIMAAEHATPAAVAFLVRHTSGVLCVAVPPERCDALDLPLMVPRNNEAHTTAFTVSVDRAGETTTGISAADRAATMRALADPELGPEAFNRPGHVFPLRAKPDGVLERPGHTEAATDLTRLAGLSGVGVLAEIVNDNGTMARRPDLHRFAEEHGLLIVSIADLVQYRRQRSELIVERIGEARVPTPWGDFRCLAFRSRSDGVEHAVFAMGDVGGDEPLLVRVQSECLTGEIFASLRCDCGSQLAASMVRIAAAGRGAVVYLRGHEGRGIGLGKKLQAYALQDAGRDTVDANLDLGLPVDSRDYTVGRHILLDLGVRSVWLLTNNPIKCSELSGNGLTVLNREPLETIPTAENLTYLRTKKERLGHLLSYVDAPMAACPTDALSAFAHRV